MCLFPIYPNPYYPTFSYVGIPIFPYLQLRGMTCMEGSSCPGSNSLELLPGGQKMEWSMIDEVV